MNITIPPPPPLAPAMSSPASAPVPVPPPTPTMVNHAEKSVSGKSWRVELPIEAAEEIPWLDRYPYHYRAQTGELEQFRVLLESTNALSYDWNSLDEDGWSMLHYASWYGHCEVIQYLLKNGRGRVNINVTNPAGATPLHFAAGAGQLEATQLLLAHGANRDRLNEEKQTPLKLLLELKPDGWQEIQNQLQQRMDLVTNEHTDLSLAAATVKVDGDVCVFLSDSKEIHPPAASLVGPTHSTTIPMVTEQSISTHDDSTTTLGIITIVTPQSLFKNGLHLIYSYLTTYEWCYSFRTCVSWYQAALSEPCREIVFDFSTRIPKQPFPLHYHFTRFVRIWSGGGTQRQFQALIVVLPKLQHITCYELNDVPDLKWPVGLTSLELGAQRSPMILDSIFRITTLKRLSLPVFRGKKWRNFHLWSNLTSLEYLSLSWHSTHEGLELSSRALQSLPVSIASLHLGTGVYTNLSDLPPLPHCTDFSRFQFNPGDLALLAKSTPYLLKLRSDSFGPQNLRDISLFTHLTRIEFTEWDERWRQSAVRDLIEGLKLSSRLTSIQTSSHFWSLSSPGVWKELGTSTDYLHHISILSIFESSGELLDVLSHFFADRLTDLSIGTGIERADHTLALDALSMMVKLKRLVINHYPGRCTDFSSAIIEYLRNPCLLPQLRMLVVTASVHRWGDMPTDGFVNYRQPTPESKMTSDTMTNTNRTEKHIHSPPPRKDAPAARLVGIETNPGPFVENIVTQSPHLTISTNVSAQTLFKDGLISIYQFLSNDDWFNAVLTCHTWLRSGQTDSHHPFLVQTKNPERVQYLVSQLTTSSISQLYGHITHLYILHLKFDVPTMVLFLKLMPRLRLLSIRLNPVDDHPDLGENEDLPKLLMLQSLRLSFGNIPRPKLITQLLTNSPSLTSVQFGLFGAIHDWTILQPLQHLTNLQKLQLFSGKDQQVNMIDLAGITQLPSTLTAMDVDSMGDFLLDPTHASVTSLTPTTEVAQSTLQKAHFLPHLKYLSLKSKEPKSFHLPTILGALRAVAPNLQHTTYSYFSGDAIVHQCFQSPQHLEFPIRLSPTLPQEELILDGLRESRSCTSITFQTWSFQLASSWSRLGSPDLLPKLTTLRFNNAFQPWMNYLIPLASKLKHLHIDRIRLDPEHFVEDIGHLIELESLFISERGGSYEELIQLFDTPLICPKLRRLRIVYDKSGDVFLRFDLDKPKEWGQNATYRLPRSIDTNLSTAPPTAPPNPPLIGIEPNPGPADKLDPTKRSSCVAELVDPSTFSTTTSVSAQTIFKEGVHLIYSYLTTREWCQAFQTCHLWLSSAVSEPSRHLLCPLDPMGNSLLTISSSTTSSAHDPSHSLAHHFTRLSEFLDRDWSGPTLSFKQLMVVMDTFPHLRLINVRLAHHSIDLSSLIDLHWPSHLTSLTLFFDTFEEPYPPFLNSLMPSWTRLKILRLSGPRSSAMRPPFDGLNLLTELEELSLRPYQSSRLSPTLRSEDLKCLPPSIQRLSIIPLPDLFALTLMPNVQQFPHPTLLCQSGQLRRLHAIMPNLTLLHPQVLFNQDIEVITQFKHLREIVFGEVYQPDDPLLFDRIRSVLVNTPTLTCIREYINNRVISKPALWLGLYQPLDHLVEGHFRRSSGELVDALVNFAPQLKILTLSTGLKRSDGTLALDSLIKLVHLEECAITLDWMNRQTDFRAIRACLDDPLRLPSLQRFELFNPDATASTLKWSMKQGEVEGARFRVKPAQIVNDFTPTQAGVESSPNSPPAAPLIGIELNPGPSVPSAVVIGPIDCEEVRPTNDLDKSEEDLKESQSTTSTSQPQHLPIPHPTQLRLTDDATLSCPTLITHTSTPIFSLPSILVRQLSAEYLYPTSLGAFGRTCKLILGDLKQCKIIYWSVRFRDALRSLANPSEWSIGHLVWIKVESAELSQCTKLNDSHQTTDVHASVPTVPSALLSIRHLTIECDDRLAGEGPFRLPPNLVELTFATNSDDRSPIPLTKFILPDSIRRIKWEYDLFANYGELGLRHVRKWPSNLKELINVMDRDVIDDSLCLPEGLLTLEFLGLCNNAKPHLIRFPHSITNLKLSFVDNSDHPFDQIIVPTSLRRLHLIFGDSWTNDLPSFTHVPRTCENLRIHLAYHVKRARIEIPPSIKQLTLLFFGFERLNQLPAPKISYFGDTKSLTSLYISRPILSQIDWATVSLPNLVRLKLHPSERHPNQPLQLNELPATLVELDLASKGFWIYAPQSQASQQSHISCMTHLTGVLPPLLQTIHLFSYSSELCRAFPASITNISFKECFVGKEFDSNIVPMQPPTHTILPHVKSITLGDTQPSTLEAWSRSLPETQLVGDHRTFTAGEDDDQVDLYHRLTYSGGRKIIREHLTYEEKFGWMEKGYSYIEPLYDTLPSPIVGADDTPPSAPLVGIEPNPGPDSNHPDEPRVESGEPIGQLTTITAQTLFPDALHIVYSYLHTTDWAHALLSCLRWCDAAATEPILRNLDCPIQIPDGRSPQLQSVPRIPPTTRFKLTRHIQRLVAPPNAQSSEAVSLGVEQLQLYLPILSSLHTIKCSLTLMTRDLASPDDICWPKSLTDLTLYRADQPNLLRSIFQIVSLKRLHLSDLYVVEYNSIGDQHPFTLFSQLTSLEHLELFKYGGKRGYSDGLMMRLDHLKYLPRSLIYLNLDHNFDYFTDQMPILPNVREFPLNDCSLQSGDLALLHRSFPNLMVIAPEQFNENDFDSLGHFSQLTTLQFPIKRPPVHGGDLETQQRVVSALKLCPNLTSLTISSKYGFLSSPPIWLELAAFLVHLTHLHFDRSSFELIVFLSQTPFTHQLTHLYLGNRIHFLTHGRLVLPLVELGCFYRLEELTLTHRCMGPADTSVDQIKRYFNQTNICPSLRLLTIRTNDMDEETEWTWDSSADKDYRVKPTIVSITQQTPENQDPIDTQPIPTRDAPSSRLVGIETNPGPIQSMTFQTLFTDGVHTIFSFLDGRNWCECIRTCHYLLHAAQTEPNRCIWFEAERRHIPSIRVGSPALLRHVSHLILPNGIYNYPRIFLLSEVVELLHNLPALRTLSGAFTGDSEDFVSPVYSWPHTLQTWELNVQPESLDSVGEFHHSYPNLMASILQCPSLTSLYISRSLFQDDQPPQPMAAPFRLLTNLQHLTISHWILFRLCPSPPVGNTDENGTNSDYFPPSLTSLNPSYYDDYLSSWELDSFRRFNLVHLKQFNLSYSCGPLDQLHRLAPHLETISGRGPIPLMKISQLSQLKDMNLDIHCKYNEDGSNRLSDSYDAPLDPTRQFTQIMRLDFSSVPLQVSDLAWQVFAHQFPNIEEISLGPSVGEHLAHVILLAFGSSLQHVTLPLPFTAPPNRMKESSEVIPETCTRLKTILFMHSYPSIDITRTAESHRLFGTKFASLERLAFISHDHFELKDIPTGRINPHSDLIIHFHSTPTAASPDILPPPVPVVRT